MAEGTSYQISATITATDRASEALNNIDKNTSRLAHTFDTMKGKIHYVFSTEAIKDFYEFVKRGVEQLVDSLKELNEKGEEWVHTVHVIAGTTGVSVEAANSLAIQAKYTGVSVEDLSRAMINFGRFAERHGDTLKRLGIHYKDTQGNLLPINVLLDQMRGRFGGNTEQMTRTIAAMDMFGRVGAKLTKFLKLTPDQVAMLNQELEKNGMILTENDLIAQSNLSNSKKLFDITLTGLGSTIFTSLAPTFTVIIDAVTKLIQNNLGEIQMFVEQIGQVIQELVTGLTGLNVASTAADTIGRQPKGPQKGTQFDQYLKAVKAGTKASSNATDAWNKQQEALIKNLEKAAKAYKDLLAVKEFGGQKSEAERIADQQARDAQLAAAKKNVDDAQKSLADFYAGNAKAAKMHGVKPGVLHWKPLAPEDTFTPEDIAKRLRDARIFGRNLAAQIQDTVFGKPVMIDIGGGHIVQGPRDGGLVGAIRDLIEAVKPVLEGFRNLPDAIQSVLKYAAAGGLAVTVLAGGMSILGPLALAGLSIAAVPLVAIDQAQQLSAQVTAMRTLAAGQASVPTVKAAQDFGTTAKGLVSWLNDWQSNIPVIGSTNSDTLILALKSEIENLTNNPLGGMSPALLNTVREQALQMIDWIQQNGGTQGSLFRWHGDVMGIPQQNDMLRRLAGLVKRIDTQSGRNVKGLPSWLQSILEGTDTSPGITKPGGRGKGAAGAGAGAGGGAGAGAGKGMHPALPMPDTRGLGFDVNSLWQMGGVIQSWAADAKTHLVPPPPTLNTSSPVAKANSANIQTIAMNTASLANGQPLSVAGVGGGPLTVATPAGGSLSVSDAWTSADIATLKTTFALFLAEQKLTNQNLGAGSTLVTSVRNLRPRTGTPNTSTSTVQ